MELYQVIILSVVEGLTEFLPVSSTGHLILFSNFLNLPPSDFLTTFNIAIQSGAILAVTTLYIKTILKNPRLITLAIVGFLPSLVAGLLLYSFITDTLFEAPLVVIAAMGIGGVLLIFVEKYFENHKGHTSALEKITYKQALYIGCVQILAVIPGTSRSASTIVGGMLFGLDRKTAVEFSFLLALPTIGAATTLDLVQNAGEFSSGEVKTLLIGIVITFVVAYFTMKYFLKLLNKNTLIYFGIYRIALALISLLILFS